MRASPSWSNWNFNAETPELLFFSVCNGNFGPKLFVFLMVNIRLNRVYWNEFCLFLGDYWTEEHSVNIACLQENIVCLQVNTELNIVCLQVNIGCL